MNPFKALFDHSERALRSTAPLYRIDDRGRRELFATGVFFQHLGRHFVLSAAHALVEMRTRPVWVGGDRTIVQLTGPFFHTGQPGQVDFDDDSFDVGFAPLNDEQVAALTDVVYVSDRAIERAPSSSSNARYFAVGFICSRSRESAEIWTGLNRLSWAVGLSASARHHVTDSCPLQSRQSPHGA